MRKFYTRVIALFAFAFILTNTANALCDVPTALKAYSTDGSSADITWTENGTASQWQIEYGAPGFAIGTGTRMLVNNDSLTLSSLMGQTTYEFYIRAICNVGDTSFWSVEETFTTTCGVFVAPYEMGFEASTTTTPECFENDATEVWKFSNSASGNHIGSNGTANGSTSSGGYFAWVDDSSPHNQSTTLETPFIDVSGLSDTVLSFYTLSDNEGDANGNVDFHVDVYDGAKWVDSVYFSDENTLDEAWELIIIDLTDTIDITGNIKVRFVVDENNASGFDDDRAIDDILIGEPPVVPAPQTCFKVLDLDASDITENSLTVFWEDTTTASSWEIEYGISGFALGSGDTEVVSDTFALIIGLDGNTTYDFYVRTICAVGDTSDFADVESFATACGSFSVPYVEGFETVPPSCWIEAGSGTPSTGPMDSLTGNWAVANYLFDPNKGSALRINLWNADDQEWVLSPNFDFSSGTPYELILEAGITAFNSTASSNMGSDDTVMVLISTDGINWTELYTWDANNQPTSNGGSFTVDLSAYSGTTNYFGIWGSEGSVDDPEDYDFYVNNFEIRERPSCPGVLGVGVDEVDQTTATVTWEDNTSLNWEIEYGVAGFARGTGDVETVLLDTSLDISGLASNTAYDFYVRAICSATDTSEAAMGSFRTECGSFTIPFTETFDSDSESGACWSVINANSSPETWESQISSNAYKGDGAYTIDSWANSWDTGDDNDDYLVSPQITLTGNDRLVYYAKNNGSGDVNSIYKVLLSETGKEEADFTETLLTDTITSITYGERIIDLSAYSGDVYVSFYMPNSLGNDPGFQEPRRIYVDEVSFEEIPSCDPPVSVKLDSTTATTAVINWLDTNNASSFYVEYDTVGFAPGTGRNNVTAIDTFTTLTALMSDRLYDYYIRAICAVGDTSTSTQGSFRTRVQGPAGITCTSGQEGTRFSEELDESAGWRGDIGTATGSRTWIYDQNATPSTSSGVTGPHSGNGYIYAESSGSSLDTVASLISPAIDLRDTDDFAELSFWFYAYSTTTIGTLNINVGGSPTGPFDDNIYSRSGQYQETRSGDWANVGVDLSAYVGEAIYLEFEYVYDGTSTVQDFALDLVEVSTCYSCVAPSDLVPIEIKNISTEVAWDENGVAEEWEIEWDTAGFTAGTARNSAVVDDTTLTLLENLSPLTDYDFYVRSVCGVGDFSDWSDTGNFTTTACIPVQNPIAEPKTIEADLSWTDAGGAAEWQLYYGGLSPLTRDSVILTTPSFNVANLDPETDHYYYVRAICTVGDSSFFSDTVFYSTAPCSNPSSLTEEVSSNQALLSWTEDNFASEWEVEFGTTGFTLGTGDNFTVTNSPDTLMEDLRANVGYDYYVKAICGNGEESNVVAATFTTTACDPVTNLNSNIYNNNAELDWKENGTAIAWQVEYGTTGYTLGTGTKLVVMDTSTLLTGLDEREDYDWYVRAICNEGDTSAWSATASFTTLTVTDNCEYSLLLEDAGANGWQGNTLDVKIGNTTTNYTLATGSEETLTLPVDLGDSIILEYQAGGIFTTQVSFSLLNANNDVVYSSGLNPVTEVNYADTARCPSCVNPTGLVATDVSVDSAFVSWTEEGSATKWEVEWDTTGFAEGTGRNTFVSENAGANDTITGLMSLTLYDFYVRAICADGDTSAYSFSGTFQSDFVCPVNAICATYTDGDISTDTRFRTLEDEGSACAESIIVSLPAGKQLDSISTVYEMTSGGPDFAWKSEQRSWLYSPVAKAGEPTVASNNLDEEGTHRYERSGLVFANGIQNTLEIEMNAGSAFDFGATGCSDRDIKLDDGTWNVITYFSDAAACAAPLFLEELEFQGDTAVLVSWLDYNTSTGYLIEWDTAGFTAGTAANRVLTSNADTTFILTGLTGFTEYDYYIRAVCGPGQLSVWSDTGSFRTLCGPPVTGLNVTDVSDRDVEMEWTENGASTLWIVEYGTAGYTPGTGSEAKVVTSASASFDGLSASTDYDFYVRAICTEDDTSAYSVAGTFTTDCGIPNNLSTDNITTDMADASWDETGIAAEWEVQWDVDGFTAGSGTNSKTVTTADAVLDNLTPSTDYEFYVRALCGSGNDSEWSLAGSFTTACGPAPSNLTTPMFNDVTDVTANVKWNENAKASDWIVEYGLSGFALGAGNTVVVSDTFTTLTGLSASTAYEYYVRSICGDDDTSAYSTAGNFTTLCGIPDALTADAGSNLVDLEWNETGIATSWEVQYGGSGFSLGNGTSIIVDVDPELTVMGLNPGTDYDFYVRAICGIGNASEFSTVGSFTTIECDVVTDLTSANVSEDTVDLGWVENGTATSWEISYGPTGFTAGMGTQVTTDTVDFTLTGLNANTSYDWYVRAVCGASGFSEWSDSAWFTTPVQYYPIGVINTEDAGGITDSIGLYARISGIVISVDRDGNDGYNFTIVDMSTGSQEGIAVTSGIDVSSYSVTEGDSILLRGTVGQNNGGLTRFSPDSISVIKSGVALPTPIIVSQLNKSTESKLIQLNNVEAINSSGVNNYVVNVVFGGDTLRVRVDADADVNDSLNIIGNRILNGDVICSVIGVGYQTDNSIPFADGNYELIPNRYSDLDRETCLGSTYYPIGTLNKEGADGEADSLGVEATTSGIVMGVDLDGNGGYIFTLIDMSSGSQEGIGIFSSSDIGNYVVTQGDSLRVSGEVTQFRGLTQMNIDTLEVIATNVTEPAPMVVWDPSQGTESKWITVNNLRFDEPTGNAGSNATIRINRDARKFNFDLRIDRDTDVDDSVAVYPIASGDDICSITGIGGQFDAGSAPLDSGYQIILMRYSDMDTTNCSFIVGVDDNSAVEEMELKVYPNPTTGQFTIHTSGFKSSSVRMTVKDLSGRIVTDENIINSNNSFQKVINIEGNAKGIYFISIFDGENVINRKLILQ